jgi:quercetin 2,3-dioxygenase
MIDIRPFASLGAANHGWLDAHHHFSFASYQDPDRMGWGRIRVWNDDSIAAQTGFPPHAHEDMEIITYVRSGSISHEDSLGNKGRTVAGDVQVMSAGTGIRHSEFNLDKETTTLFQIWVLPDRTGDAPRWDQRPFPKTDRAGQWVVLASGNPADQALEIRADARVLGAKLGAGDSLSLDVDEGRVAYLVPSAGSIVINGKGAAARDGIAVSGPERLTIATLEGAELVVVEARA